MSCRCQSPLPRQRIMLIARLVEQPSAKGQRTSFFASYERDTSARDISQHSASVSSLIISYIDAIHTGRIQNWTDMKPAGSPTVLGVPSIYAYTLPCRTTEFDVVTHMGRGFVVTLSATASHASIGRPNFYLSLPC